MVSLDQLAGIRTIIDRMDLPPKARHLVTRMEGEHGPLEHLPEIGGREVREILQLTDGATLLCAIAALVIDTQPVESRTRTVVQQDKIVTDYDLWLGACSEADGALAMIEIGEHFVAFDQHAILIADTLQTHVAHISGRTELRLRSENMIDWRDTLAEALLDVVLVSEVDGETRVQHVITDYEKRQADKAALLTAAPTEPETQPEARPQLDHDGDGKAGGSLPGDESTAHKGAVKKRSRRKSAK